VRGSVCADYAAKALRRASKDPAAASINPSVPNPAGPSAGTVDGGARNTLPKRSCAIANPPAALGAVIVTLVIGVALDAVISSAPLYAIVRVSVPSTDAPLKNVAVMLNGLPATFAGSSSNPNVVAGLLSVSVSVAPTVATTRGVLLSVLGGDPQKFQVVPVVNAIVEGANVTVVPPAVSEFTVLKSAPTTGIAVVFPVYCAVGVEIVRNWAEAGSTAASPIHNRVRKLRIFVKHNTPTAAPHPESPAKFGI
jgi:hypothetical protein